MNDLQVRRNRIYLQWHLTNKCRNRCKHCYQDTYTGRDISLSSAHSIMADFLDCCDAFEALPVIALTGGDPMLNTNFWSILRELRKQAKFDCISILGNPERINDDVSEKLSEFNLKHFQLSVDGMETTHDAIRYKGSFKRTMQAIECLSKNGIPVYIMSTISSINYREMSDVMRSVYDCGAMHWMFARWIPSSKGDCGISPLNYLKFLRTILQNHKRYEKRGYKKLRKEPLIALCQGSHITQTESVVSGGCGMGSSTITMLPDKTLMACRRHPASIIGKWTSEFGFLHHFINNPEMEKYRNIDKIDECGDCKLVKYCRGCRAASYVAYGEDFKKDPQCSIFLNGGQLNN